MKAVVIWNTCVSAKPRVSTRQHSVDEQVPSLSRLSSNEQLVCSLSLRRVGLSLGLGVCQGHSEELSTIKQSGHNVKSSDLLSNPCLTELCSTPESAASSGEEQLVYRWPAEEGQLLWDTFKKKKKKKKTAPPTLQELLSLPVHFEKFNRNAGGSGCR